MKKYMLGLAAGFCLVLCSGAAYAQEAKLTIKCHPKPRNINFFKQALKDRLLASVDLSKYENPSVALRMNLIGLQTVPVALTSQEVAGDLNIVSQPSPEGLAFTVEGEIRFDRECLYTYRVLVGTRGRDKTSGARVYEKTSSEISVRAPMDGRFRKGDTTVTPTPTATPNGN